MKKMKKKKDWTISKYSVPYSTWELFREPALNPGLINENFKKDWEKAMAKKGVKITNCDKYSPDDSLKTDNEGNNMIGIEFTYNDGTKDWYDPVDYPDDFEETETIYRLHMAHLYEIEKAKVKSIRRYALCQECGYEIKNNECSNGSCATNDA